MKIKRHTIIIELSHEDLVNLFGNSLYNNPRIRCDYEKNFYKTIPVSKVSGDSFEDKIADVLLNGGKVYLYDEEADGKVYGDRGELIEKSAMYPTTLEDIEKGLENAFNGNFTCNNEDDKEHIKEYAMECAEDLYNNDGCLDLTEADTLLQIIMFNEIIFD